MDERAPGAGSPQGLEALQPVVELAERAGRLLLQSFGRLDPARIGSKSASRDLVTEADVASERLLVAGLRQLTPEATIQAEEETDDAPVADRPRWFVDPLDGTVNFVHGLPAFCVSLGLYDGRVPRWAVVHAPLLGETFFAARGEGAWLRQADGPPRRLAVSSATHLSEAVVGTGFPYRRGELANDNLGNFARLFREVRGLRRMGSAALDLAFTAAGRLDVFWELHLGAHDLAAGALLVLEAGGVVTDLDGGPRWLERGQLVAGPGPLHAALLERVTDRPDPLEPPARP